MNIPLPNRSISFLPPSLDFEPANYEFSLPEFMVPQAEYEISEYERFRSRIESGPAMHYLSQEPFPSVYQAAAVAPSTSLAAGGLVMGLAFAYVALRNRFKSRE